MKRPWLLSGHLGRLHLCAVLCLAPVAPIAARLVALQVVDHRDYSARARSETERERLEIIPRGRILDREGRVLAESLPSWSSYLDLRGVKDARKLAQTLAPALALQASELQARLKTKRRDVWLKRKMTPEETEALRRLRLPTVGIVPDESRFYPNGALARSLLGSVGADGKGNAGLEYELDARISGRARRVGLTRDAAGNAVLQEPRGPDHAPPDVRLAVDKVIQYYAEEELAAAVQEHSAKRGIAVVQDPRTGDVLALAVHPPDPMRNPAIQEVYEPGSTFKIVVAAAALEGGLLKPGERVDCEGGRWELVPGTTVKDHHPMGPSTLPEIIQHSSNIGTGKLGLRLGGDFVRFCRLFGFGYKTGVPFPAESAGLLRVPERGDPVRLANAAFGQGVAVTPLQLAAAFSAVANGGALMEPRLVLGEDGAAPPAPARVREVMSSATAARLQEMLELVVEKGTGMSARIPGYRAAGKTGTAQKLDPATGRYSSTDYVSSFAGYAPARDPRFTILVVVDSPRGKHYGSEVAAPVFSRLSRRILALWGVAPDLPLEVREEKAPAAAKKSLPRPSIL